MHRIKPSVDTEETGSAYPAVESYSDYNFNSERSIYNLRTNTRATFDPELRFNLANDANLTDLLSEATFNSAGLLVSSNLLEILEGFNIAPYITYAVPISTNHSEVEYFWIHFVWEEWYTYVDWGLSTFRLFENGNFSPLEIESYEEYALEVSKSKFFRVAPDNVTLLPIPYDMYCHPFEGEIKISYELAISLMISKVSGIEIQPKPLNLVT